MDVNELIKTRAELRKIISTQGIRSALVYLNTLTGHRFTALYRFDDDMLRKTYFYDNENPSQEDCPDIPIEASYCIYLKRNPGVPFSTPNSLDDQRVIEHPKRKEILSYCGVPLTDNAGVMFGSICHFDFHPMETNTTMVELMESLATILTEIRDSGTNL